MILFRHRAALIASVVLVSVSGCPSRHVDEGDEGDDGGAGETDDGDAMGDDLARLAAAMCERHAACGCEQIGDPLDADACAAVHYEGLLRLGQDSAEAAGYAFDAACLQELADCWEQLACGQSHDDAVASCATECAVHQRNLDTGSECESETFGLGPTGFVAQCEPGLACLGGHGYAVCDTPAPLQVGESCHDGAYHRSCAPELYCADQDGVPSQCEPRVGEGVACDTSKMCSSGLRCDDGVCRPRGEPGTDCELTADCKDGLTCHPIERECVGPAEIGQPCRFPVGANDEFVPCVEGAWCGEENCEPPLELGSACMYSDGCPEASACEGGLCTACAAGSCAADPICYAVPHPYSYPSGE